MKVPSVEEIIEKIVTMLYKESKSTLTVVKYLKSKYDINKSRAYDLITLARAKVGKLYKEINKTALEDAIASLEDMKERARKKNDIKIELEVQKELNKVLELHKKVSLLDETMADKITIIIDGKKKEG